MRTLISFYKKEYTDAFVDSIGQKNGRGQIYPAVFHTIIFLFLWKIDRYNLTVFHTNAPHILHSSYRENATARHAQCRYCCDGNIRFSSGFFPNFIQQIIDLCRQPRESIRRPRWLIASIPSPFLSPAHIACCGLPFFKILLRQPLAFRLAPGYRSSRK